MPVVDLGEPDRFTLGDHDTGQFGKRRLFRRFGHSKLDYFLGRPVRFCRQASLTPDSFINVNGFGPIFLTIWLVGLIAALLLQRRNISRVATLKFEVRSQLVTYSTTAAFVRLLSKYGVWVTLLNGFGRCQLLIRSNELEVSLAGSRTGLGDILGVSRYLHANETRMWIDKVGWMGTSIERNTCIRLSGKDANGPVELAIRPDAEIGEVWNALQRAGVWPAFSPS